MQKHFKISKIDIMPLKKTPTIQVLAFIRAILAMTVIAPLTEVAASDLILPDGAYFVMCQKFAVASTFEVARTLTYLMRHPQRLTPKV